MSEVRGWQVMRKMEQGQWKAGQFYLGYNTRSADLSSDGQVAGDQIVCTVCYSDSVTESY